MIKQYKMYSGASRTGGKLQLEHPSHVKTFNFPCSPLPSRLSWLNGLVGLACLTERLELPFMSFSSH